MDRGDQAQDNVPPTQNPQTQGVAPPPGPPPPQEQPPPTPQAALASIITRGENPPPPAPPPKTEIDLSRARRATTSDTAEKYNGETASGHGSEPPRDPYRRGSTGGVGIGARPRSFREGMSYHSGENVAPTSRRHRSGLDWIIPVDDGEKPYVPRQRTAGERLQPTLDYAKREKIKYERKAMLNGYALNLAIGLQVILGALITGLSAAIKPEKVGITTAILGGLSTLVASFLARMRGSNEPELSITRTKDLEQFIRECDAFLMDRGHITGDEEDHTLEEFRRKFEELLGNASGERKLSPPV